MSGYSVAQIDEIEEVDDGRCPMRPVRHHLGIRSFGINAWVAKSAGDRLINEHDEDDEQEELYVVQRGRATFELDGERVDVPAGGLVFVRPGVKRTAVAEEDGTTLLAMGGTPGEAYQVDGWELWSPLNALYQAGRYDEAAERGRALIEANPGLAGVLYNTACCESLAGQKKEAIEHLRQAVESSERFRSFAAGDSDLDALRDDPAFQELMRPALD